MWAKMWAKMWAEIVSFQAKDRKLTAQIKKLSATLDPCAGYWYC